MPFSRLVPEAVVVAGGSSRRMGIDKLRAPIAGHPLLLWSVRLFLAMNEWQRIVVVLSDDELAGILPVDNRIVITRGGDERAGSVRAGLAGLSPACSHVAIHDAARPLALAEDVRSCLSKAVEIGACILGEPCTDTLHRADRDGRLFTTVERESLWRAQTPQIFALPLLMDCLAEATGPLTDEAGALIACGRKVGVLSPRGPNFKVTYPADLELANFVLEQRLST
jgi:2-C-methyl-D-erythritol 4-phosphate cytidylyltransferase